MAEASGAQIHVAPEMLAEGGEYTTMIELNQLMHDVTITVNVRRRNENGDPVQHGGRVPLIPSWVPAWRCGAPTTKPGKPPCRYSWKMCPVFKHAKIRVDEGKPVSGRYAGRFPNAVLE